MVGILFLETGSLLPRSCIAGSWYGSMIVFERIEKSTTFQAVVV